MWTYDSAQPSASAVIIRNGRFLIIRRAHEPSAGQWDIPGGFYDGDEHPAATAVRESREETGLHIRLGPLVGLYMGQYTQHGITSAALNAYYLAQVSHPTAAGTRTR